MTHLVANPGVLGVKQQLFPCLLLERNPGPEPRQHLAELRRMCNGQHEIDPIITLYPEALPPHPTKSGSMKRVFRVTDPGKVKDVGRHGAVVGI